MQQMRRRLQTRGRRLQTLRVQLVEKRCATQEDWFKIVVHSYSFDGSSACVNDTTLHRIVDFDPEPASLMNLNADIAGNQVRRCRSVGAGNASNYSDAKFTPGPRVCWIRSNPLAQWLLRVWSTGIKSGSRQEVGQRWGHDDGGFSSNLLQNEAQHWAIPQRRRQQTLQCICCASRWIIKI